MVTKFCERQLMMICFTVRTQRVLDIEHEFNGSHQRIPNQYITMKSAYLVQLLEWSPYENLKF